MKLLKSMFTTASMAALPAMGRSPRKEGKTAVSTEGDQKIIRDSARLDQAFAKLRSYPPSEIRLDAMSMWIIIKMIQVGASHPSVPDDLRAAAEHIANMIATALTMMAPEIEDLIEQFPIGDPTCDHDQ